jgi:catechol 2,3-dioxygenase-like lactoylglutathione lyase family enzyme
MIAMLPGKVEQIGIVVPDLDQALAYWIDFMGVGPFFVVPRFDLHGVDYRGTTRDLAIALAFAYSGSLQIELVMPLDDTPSVFTEVPASNPHTLHHFGVLVDDFDHALRVGEQGRSLIQRGQTEVMRHAFLQCSQEPRGISIELLESTPAIRSLFEHVRAASQGWNGRDPVRSL